MAKLTDKAVLAAAPREKDYKLADGDGLHLLVKKTGSKIWRFKYRFDGKEKLQTIGPYPDVSLKEARDCVFASRRKLRDGIDPMLEKKATKAAQSEAKVKAQLAVENRFEEIAKEWFEKVGTDWAGSHSDRIINRLEKDVFPWLGKRDVAEITAPELLKVIRRIEARGALETAHRVISSCGRIFRYAIATARAQHDPSVHLRGARPPRTRKNHLAALTDSRQIAELLRDIDG